MAAALRKLTIVLDLIDEPVTGTDSCANPREQFDACGGVGSPKLLNKIYKHISHCSLCRERDDPRKLRGRVFTASLLAYMLERIIRTAPGKITTGVVAVAAVATTAFSDGATDRDVSRPRR